MSVTHKTGPCENPVTHPALTFPYTPDDFQNHSFNAMESGKHVLVTAHTGSGKTTVAEYAVAYGMKLGKKVIYTAPIKALSNQIFGDFHRKYPDWSLGIRTGDIDYNSEESQVLIMTTEILQNMLYRESMTTDESSRLPLVDLNDVGVVVFDEVHYIKDRDRGSVWERSIMMMPSHIQMIMLSATLPDADKFCSWIAECKGRDIVHTTTSFRAVPLTHYMWGPKLIKIMDEKDVFDAAAYNVAAKEGPFSPSQLDSVIKRINTPALFFCFSKKQCQTHAHNAYSNARALVDPKAASAIDKEFTRLLRKFKDRESLSVLQQTQDVRRLVSKGIGYHHAGLLPPLKEIIQELFSQGLIQVLFVTETFAAGVNMPAKTVVFTGFSKYDNHCSGFRTLLPEEYGQMAGRAGRRGMDKVGTVIHLPMRDMLTAREARDMMCGKIRDIVSRIKPSYNHILNSILQGHSIGGTDPSLQQRQTDEQIAGTKALIAKLETQLKTAEEAVQFYRDHQPELLERVELHHKYKAGELGRKQLKQYKKSGTERWIQDNHCEFHKAYGHYTAWLSTEQELAGNICHLDGLENSGYNDTFDMIDFLVQSCYIHEMKELEDYTPSDVAVKGVMAVEIHEVNALLLTEVVYQDYLDGLCPEDLVAVLAIFLTSKEIQRDNVCNRNTVTAITQIQQLAETMSVSEQRFSPCVSDWGLGLEFCDMVYLWAKGKSVDEVYGYTQSDIHVGEFVRMVLKLNNICKETLKIAQIAHKDALCKQLQNHQELLIRDVTVPQSLYVS